MMPWAQKACGMGVLEGTERVRWYNPKLEDFEWKETPESDEEALSLLEGSPYTPISTETYRQWRELGSSIEVALIRAGESAKGDRQQRAAP